MDLVQLRYFLKVVELRSFTRAAAALHIAQPAITRQVRMLEEELDVQLLLRHSRGAEPTAAGVRLSEGAGAMFRLLGQTRADVAASASEVSGTLRIGFPPSLGDLLIGSTVGLFRSRYPRVVLSLQEGYSHSLRDGLLADRLDVALLTGGDSNQLLVTTHLFDETLWLLDPPGPRARTGVRRRPFDFAEIGMRDLVQPSRANTLRQLVDNEIARAGGQSKVVVEAESLSLIKDLVRRGVGSHVSPYSAVGAAVQSGEFPGGPVRDAHIARYLAHRIDRPMSLAFARFNDLLQERVREIARASRGAIRLVPGMLIKAVRREGSEDAVRPKPRAPRARGGTSSAGP
ncbi:LysR family transcriptional regulator [Variovorax sp. N23]|uniref:LysR family transcriptional regulator n=1 Tax=Variovorax sp. N23 TaxID=2980555 RepID=UPI0021C93BED|nr:LysR substrate-binding domain-containing protein [Variovorax sp. N23]MCU4121158.1 LysR substrate-binding domain-containing protein [Variovorax sp. N23]